MLDVDAALTKIEEARRQAEMIECQGDALAFLKAVYQSPAVSLPARMKAAAIAIEYERPRLAVTANLEGKDFAAMLDARLQRLKDREREPRIIDKQPNPIAPILPTPDKRYRRS